MLPIRKNTVPGALLVLVAATRGASAVPNVTQVIDGLPQVIAPQQIIVQCNPALLPLLCTTALDTTSSTATPFPTTTTATARRWRPSSRALRLSRPPPFPTSVRQPERSSCR